MGIDSRISSFVESSGVLPCEARRLRDDEAQAHGAAWVQRLLGKGIACEHVAGYAHGDRWWTFCFERRASLENPHDGAEVWRVETHDSTGRGLRDFYQYWADSDRWQLLRADPADTTPEAGDSTPPDDQTVFAPIVLVKCDESVGSSTPKLPSLWSAVRGLLWSRR